MSVSKIQTPYSAKDFSNGDILAEGDLDAMSQGIHDSQVKINEVIDELANSGGGGGGTVVVEGNSHVTFNDSKKNLTIETTETRANGKGGHINVEPAGDFQVKPVGTEKKYTHHRDADHLREYKVAILNGANEEVNGVEEDDYPVDFKVQAANLELNTEDKQAYIGHVNADREAAGKDNTSDDDKIFNLNVTTGVKKAEATRQNPHFAYFKVHARAMDFRCEEHGGIALQPFGCDSQGHENKIKFEHGGGDGKEFFTMNTEKMSAYVDEYRFKKTGKWIMATRLLLDNTKNAGGNDKFEHGDDETKHYSYQKQSDDFLDIVNVDDPQCTTEELISTIYALNGAPGIHTQITSKGNVEIETNEKYIEVASTATAGVTIGSLIFGNTVEDSVGTIFTPEQVIALVTPDSTATLTAALANVKNGEIVEITGDTGGILATPVTKKFKKVARSINIESCAGIKLKGELDFGSTFNFGETDNGIEVQHKMTKNKLKRCYSLKVVAVNNHASNNITIDKSVLTYTDPNDPESACTLDNTSATIAPGETAVVAEASIYDIIKLTNWMKANHEGPWQTANTNL